MDKNVKLNTHKKSFDKFGYDGGTTRYPKDSVIMTRSDGTVYVKRSRKTNKSEKR